ncbi:MAG: NMD3-related protein [Candidatus Woesearchaeota archaeon]
MDIETKTGQKPASYFEGILQLRNPTPELIDWVKKRITSDAKAKIAKIVPLADGVDFYLSSQRYLRALGRLLRQRFFGELKTSRKLFSISPTGKRLYRVNVLFRFFNVKKGDVLKIGEEEFEVIGLDNQVRLKNIRTGKKIRKTIEFIARYLKAI